MKDLVYKIQSIPGVSVHIPDHGIISIGNGSGYNPRIQSKGIDAIKPRLAIIKQPFFKK